MQKTKDENMSEFNGEFHKTLDSGLVIIDMTELENISGGGGDDPDTSGTRPD